ncbi:hypothetical protein F5X96DRAFT_671532 [Biscogniauxia mediterranea]|nr:hypothetical protein F5X96DRAFT_671532 [Biscogniauxia mediterranea]
MTLDLEDFYFVFGPDESYWFDGPKCCEYGGIPETWDPETRRHVHRLDSLAMGPRGEKFLRFHDRRGREYFELNPALRALHPPLSAHLLASRPHAPRLAFGPPGSAAALAWSDAHVYPHAIPAAAPAGRVLAREILGLGLQQPSGGCCVFDEEGGMWGEGGGGGGWGGRQMVIGGDRDRPRLKHASFGVGWAFFYLAEDGRWWFDGAGCYGALEGVLARLGWGDVQFLALNPYRVEEFFLLLTDHTALFRVPLSSRRALDRALRRHGVCSTPSSFSSLSSSSPSPSPSAFPSSLSALFLSNSSANTHCCCCCGDGRHESSKIHNSRRKHKHKYWKDFASLAGGQVAGHVAGAVVTTVATAVVGSAACSVM